MKQQASRQPSGADFIDLIERNKALEIETKRSSKANVKRRGAPSASANAFGFCFHDQGR